MFMQVILSAMVVCFTSCDKENEKTRKAFTMTSNTWYRFSPTAPSNVTVSGTNFTGFAYVPGGGTGTATDMGSITTFYNQLAYTTNPNVPQPLPDGSIAASVSSVTSYAVLGAPLPLIQAGDFSALTTANSTFQIPATDASGKIINSIFFNSSGDAIFTANTTASTITPVSATRLNFAGKLNIVGGRGKFANATGEMDFNGFFNPQNPNEAGYGITGQIEY